MLIRYLAMVVDRIDPQPLEYSTRPPRTRVSRGVIVALIGAGMVLIATVVFVCAHKLAEPYGPYTPDVNLHELLWAAFGLALLLAGASIVAVGLHSWCRSGAG